MRQPQNPQALNPEAHQQNLAQAKEPVEALTPPETTPPGNIPQLQASVGHFQVRRYGLVGFWGLGAFSVVLVWV